MSITPGHFGETSLHGESSDGSLLLELWLAKRIDLANVADCRAQLIAVVPSTAPGLVVDLSKTTYLDSRGVHLILELAERLRTSQQQLRLVVPEPSVVRRVLLLTQVDKTVPLHRSVQDALQHLR